MHCNKLYIRATIHKDSLLAEYHLTIYLSQTYESVSFDPCCVGVVVSDKPFLLRKAHKNEGDNYRKENLL